MKVRHWYPVTLCKRVAGIAGANCKVLAILLVGSVAAIRIILAADRCSPNYILCLSSSPIAKTNKGRTLTVITTSVVVFCIAGEMSIWRPRPTEWSSVYE